MTFDLIGTKNSHAISCFSVFKYINMQQRPKSENSSKARAKIENKDHRHRNFIISISL